MALWQNASSVIWRLDDTAKITCFIENAQNINKHTEYIIRVQRGPVKENMWNVSRRYSDFASLHSLLLKSNIDLPLPPKKLIGNMQPSFIAERQVALQNYLNEVLKHQILALSLSVRSFLDPNNYSLAISEQSLQTVSIALRGDLRYELKGPIADIGWRIRKHYFLMSDISSKTNCLLSYQHYGPDRYLCDKDLQTAFKSLQNLSHPYIDQILAIHNLENGAYVIRRIHESGSLRDILYGTEYSKHYLMKYGNPKIRKPFTTGQIAHYGYQILQAIKFLHEKGLPHGHIHPGNIAIENQRALLMEVENFVIGVPCLYRPYLLELRRVTTPEDIDVYCFGRTLYEMTFAIAPEDPHCDYFPDGINMDLESVLHMCLSSHACKHGMPTVDSLLRHPFFCQAPLNGLTVAPRDEKIHLKFPIQLKEELKAAVSSAEARLKREQKLVRSAKREVRIQEILSSEEEMKKQKKRMKKRESIWKSTSSLADTVRSASTASSPSPPAPRERTPPPPPQGADMGAAEGAPPPAGRSALLHAICAFDKSRLARVSTR